MRLTKANHLIKVISYADNANTLSSPKPKTGHCSFRGTEGEGEIPAADIIPTLFNILLACVLASFEK